MKERWIASSPACRSELSPSLVLESLQKFPHGVLAHCQKLRQVHREQVLIVSLLTSN